MDIVIIGSGNVAYHIAAALQTSGQSVKQLFARNTEELSLISNKLSIPFNNENLKDADLYIICVSDSAIQEVSKRITNPNALVVHTSGSMPKEILEGNYRKGSWYPLQTFSKNKNLNYSEIPFFIETESEADLKLLWDMTLKISDKIQESTFEKRKYIHLTAVFACNFVNHLFARAKEISDEQNIPFDYFIPLIDETVDKINYLEPKKAQTGPAVRNDQRILELHEQLLTDPEKLAIYQTMNQSIKKMYEL